MTRYKVKRILKFDKTPIKCDLCNKEVLGSRALKIHFTQIHAPKTNTGIKRGPKFGRKAWNKGLTKETDLRVLKNSKNSQKALKVKKELGSYKRKAINLNLEALKRLSEKQSLSNSGGKCKWFEISGYKVQGTWELNFAKKLNNFNIHWEKILTNNNLFKYIKNNKTCSYAPDFYLKELNMYVEIKGYWWGNDKEKMQLIFEQFPNTNIKVVEKQLYKQILSAKTKKEIINLLKK